MIFDVNLDGELRRERDREDDQREQWEQDEIAMERDQTARAGWDEWEDMNRG